MRFILSVFLIVNAFSSAANATLYCDAGQWAAADAACRDAGSPTGACTCGVKEDGSTVSICDDKATIVRIGPKQGPGAYTEGDRQTLRTFIGVASGRIPLNALPAEQTTHPTN